MNGSEGGTGCSCWSNDGLSLPILHSIATMSFCIHLHPCVPLTAIKMGSLGNVASTPAPGREKTAIDSDIKHVITSTMNYNTWFPQVTPQLLPS